MIKLERLPLAQVVKSWLDDRAATLAALLEAGQEVPDALASSYRDPRIKEHLLLETSYKCAYCESKITQTYWGDVEHIKPKALFDRESLDSQNLTIACALCNNSKRDYWHEEFPVINPFVDDPSEHVFAFGVFIHRCSGKPRGRITIAHLDLNRQALLERRTERIQLLEALVEQYNEAAAGPIKDVLRDELRRNAGGSSEYAMVVRAFLRHTTDITVDA